MKKPRYKIKSWKVWLPCKCCWGRFQHKVHGRGRYPFYCPTCKESGAVDRLMRSRRKRRGARG